MTTMTKTSPLQPPFPKPPLGRTTIRDIDICPWMTPTLPFRLRRLRLHRRLKNHEDIPNDDDDAKGTWTDSSVVPSKPIYENDIFAEDDSVATVDRLCRRGRRRTREESSHEYRSRARRPSRCLHRHRANNKNNNSQNTVFKEIQVKGQRMKLQANMSESSPRSLSPRFRPNIPPSRSRSPPPLSSPPHPRRSFQRNKVEAASRRAYELEQNGDRMWKLGRHDVAIHDYRKAMTLLKKNILSQRR